MSELRRAERLARRVGPAGASESHQHRLFSPPFSACEVVRGAQPRKYTRSRASVRADGAQPVSCATRAPRNLEQALRRERTVVIKHTSNHWTHKLQPFPCALHEFRSGSVQSHDLKRSWER